MSDRVRVWAPGKINLVLRSGALDDSGYHPLATVFQAVSLGEDVTASAAAELTMRVTGRDADRVPTGSSNLVLRAARLLQTETGTTLGAHLRVRKRIPVGGGMAGGSADAAATLIACNQLWSTGLSRAELTDLGVTLGADVPFALHGRTAVGLGRGDQLTPALVRGTYHWVLALQETGMSTPEVFSQLDATTDLPRAPHLDDELLRALGSGEPDQLAPLLENDLQSAALELRPELEDVLLAAQRGGALAAVVSGSGPTVASLCLDELHAHSVAAVIDAAEVSSEVLVVSGPAPGARALEAMTH